MRRLLLLLICLILSPSRLYATGTEDLFRNFQDHAQYQNVIVERVLSADTILLEGDKKIKLIGLKAPDAPRRPKYEYDKNGKPVEPTVFPENTLEEKAYAFAHKLLTGKHVRLEFDSSKVDDRLVTVAYVFILEDNIFANTEILRYGYADLQIQPPNFKYEDQLRAAYQEARREKRGLQNN